MIVVAVLFGGLGTICLWLCIIVTVLILGSIEEFLRRKRGDPLRARYGFDALGEFGALCVLALVGSGLIWLAALIATGGAL